MLRLIPEDRALLERLESPGAFQEAYRADVTAVHGLARDVVVQTLDFQDRLRATLPWGGYLGVCTSSDRVVGCGGFKGNPTPDGEVEIAYHTFPCYEGRGFAGAMAGELVRIASGEPTVRSVLAHTLPEENASTRILRRHGFVHEGPVEDAGDGTIWRWRRQVTTP